MEHQIIKGLSLSRFHSTKRNDLITYSSDLLNQWEGVEGMKVVPVGGVILTHANMVRVHNWYINILVWVLLLSQLYIALNMS